MTDNTDKDTILGRYVRENEEQRKNLSRQFQNIQDLNREISILTNVNSHQGERISSQAKTIDELRSQAEYKNTLIKDLQNKIGQLSDTGANRLKTKDLLDTLWTHLKATGQL